MQSVRSRRLRTPVRADDRPLVCNASTKLVLDSYIRAQITKKLFGSEVVEVLAASFR